MAVRNEPDLPVTLRALRGMNIPRDELPRRRDRPEETPDDDRDDPLVPPGRKPEPIEDPPKRRDEAPEPPPIDDPRPPKPKRIVQAIRP